MAKKKVVKRKKKKVNSKSSAARKNGLKKTTSTKKKTSASKRLTPKKKTTKKKPAAKKYKLKILNKLFDNKSKKNKTIIIIIALILVINILPIKIFKKNNTNNLVQYVINTRKKSKLVKECLNSKDIPEEVKESINPLEQDLYSYIKKYNIGFKYKEETLNYELAYNSDKVFYGASLIKLVDALYLIDKDVDLTKTKKYESKYEMNYSKDMAKRKIGENVTLEDLMHYAISVSDNSAHAMLISYIGFSNLQNYGRSLGGKVILQGGDNFGNQTADDMIIYLDKAYELINTKENGKLLKDAMLNKDTNYLNFDDVVLGHKYGSYNVYFHDVGIYFSGEPYLIAVLTTSDKNKSVVTNVSKKVYNIHNELIKSKTEYCNNQI